MGLKKNVFYNIFLTTGLYVTQLITYPYVTRILGVTNIGIYNFVNSFVNLFVLISSLGIMTLGTREIARCNGERQKLDKCFSALFYLLSSFTGIVLLFYTALLFLVPDLETYSTLLSIGLFYIVFNTFTIEWFFKGIENFRYITCRTLVIRMLYVVLVFVFIREESHYIRYFAISVLVVFLNALINWTYAHKLVRLVKVSVREIRSFLKPFIALGIQLVLLSYYRTINPILLGFMSNDTEVGYYTTATKLSLIILLVYNAYTMVMLPRVSSLVNRNETGSAQKLISVSFRLLYLFSIPLILYAEIFTPEIIRIIAGPGYEGVVVPMRICLSIILLGGISQILINQVLIPNNLEKGVLISALISVSAGCLANLILIPHYQSTATSLTWIISEGIIIAGSLRYAVRHLDNFTIQGRMLAKYLLAFLPLIGLGGLKYLDMDTIYISAITAAIFIVYFHLVLKYVLKDDFYNHILNRLIKR